MPPPSEAKINWARIFPGAAGPGASSLTTNAGAPVGAANTATAVGSQKPGGKLAKGPKELSGESVLVLVEGLVYLASPSFLEGTYRPENLERTGEASIDDALSHAATVVSVWNDPSHLSLAVKTWPATEKSLKDLLTQAGKQGLDAGMLKNARQAVDNITKHLGIRVAKEKAAKSAKPLSTESLEVLVKNLAYLANSSFLQGGYKPKPLANSGERSIDEALAQAAETVKLWNDPSTLPKAREYWREAERRLYALLAQASDHGFDSAKLTTARQAVENITKYLGIRLAQGKIAEAEKGIETPDVGEAFAVRELKKLEPSMKVWRDSIKQSGKLAGDPKLKELSRAIDTYFSVSEMPAKLAALQKAGLPGKLESLGDVVPFLSHLMVSAGSAVTEEGIRAAKMASNRIVVEALEKRLKLVRVVGGAVALYELAVGTKKLIAGIEKGDWHEIAEGGFEIVSGGVGFADAIGVIEGSTATGATVVAVVIWAEVEAILMVGEMWKWEKEYTALQAVKAMIADTKKIVPAGKKMAAAAQLMLDAQGGTIDPNQDRAGVAEIEAYERQATKLAGLVAKAMRVLSDNHYSRNDRKSVGGYPELVKALGAPARKALSDAFSGILPEDPFSVSEAFKTIVIGVRSMADKGNELYGAAGSGAE